MKNLREHIITALVRLGHAIHSDAGGQLLGAYTALEILLDGDQSTLANRIDSLVGERGRQLWNFVTKSRNNYVHSTVEISEREARSSVYLAGYALCAYASLGESISNDALTIADMRQVVDNRWFLKNKSTSQIRSWALDEELFSFKYEEFEASKKAVVEQGEYWESYQTLVNSPDENV